MIEVKDENAAFKGIRFPWEAVIFLAVGLASEVVDAMFMNATLEVLGPDLDSLVAMIISYIVGAGCFFSMAFAGFQLADGENRKGIRISYVFWALAGVSLVCAKLLAGLVGGGLSEVMSGGKSMNAVFGTEDFISSAVIALIQLVLYVGTGFMTRDAVKILADKDMRECMMMKRRYKQLLLKLSEKRGDITEDIAKLRVYRQYAKRLVASKQSVKKSIAQYNESARALIEARMAIRVEPDIMDDMYYNAMAKEGRPVKRQEQYKSRVILGGKK